MAGIGQVTGHESWQEIRSQVLRRDAWQCQSCGRRTVGQVHHIIPRRGGGSNDLSNLLTLCGKCHMLVSPVPDWVIVRVWRVPLGHIASARQQVLDNLRKYRPNEGRVRTEDRKSDFRARSQADATMGLKEQVSWLNAYLSTVYSSEMRLSTLLARLGFDSQQLQVIRDKNLDLFVNSYIAKIKEQIAARRDGERLFMIISHRLVLDGEPPATLQSLGERLGISRERVRQLEMKALKRCRHNANRIFLESSLLDLARRHLKLEGQNDDS